MLGSRPFAVRRIPHSVRRRGFLSAATAAIAAGTMFPYGAARADDLVIIGKDRWLFAAWERLVDPEDDQIQVQLDLVARARDLFAAKGIALIFMVAPMKARFYLDQLPDGTVMSDAVKGRYERVMQWVADRRLSSIDVSAAILPVAGVNGQTLFHETDQHWTGWSAEAAGSALAELIAKSVQLPPATGKGERLNQWVSVELQGDLARLVPANLQARYALETFVVRQSQDYVLQPQDALGNDIHVPDPSVRIVGSSLCNRFAGLPRRLSNALNRPIALTWLSVDKGPWQLMLNFVESAGFAKKPSVIIWQFNEAFLPHGPMGSGWFAESSLMPPEKWLARLTTALSALP
jgi:alginate O-acetyltransferase complex protein AlgJ